MKRSQIFKKAHARAAAWMQDQEKYRSMYKYKSYAECFAACLRSIWRDEREDDKVQRFYSRYDKALQAARMQD